MDLNELIANIENHIINEGDFRDIGYLLESYGSTDWLNYIDSDTTGIKRNIVYLSSNIEIIIISWKAGYETLPHDHSRNGCWLKLLTGELSETLYNQALQEECNKIIKPRQISFMHNDFGYHSIKNSLETNSYSIHIYSPPKHKTNYFQL